MLRPAGLADIGFVRSLVGRLENAPYLTDEDDQALAGYLTDPAARMLIWRDDPARGFAIFCDIGAASGAVCLMRLALSEPGRGEGTVFLRRLIDHGFGTLQAKRLWLDASGENTRAQRAYVRAGFLLEGRLRQHEYVPRIGRVIDTLYYGMLRPEWEALEPLRVDA
ncbi:MAG: GNAT family N-acetyltransferase [Rhodobacterales bacterium]|nr:GNAT family N-acetyltransferase [Rhodobacterales bacterium]